VTAQAKPLPADTAITPLVSPETCTGTEEQSWFPVGSKQVVVVELFPSSPSLLSPQHSTPPPPVTAQAKLVPADTAVTPLVSPETCTGTELFVVELFPSSPPPLEPQHSTPPPALRAQAKSFPADTAVTPLVSPETGTGTELFVVELFPSWPE
jgi:hypothetical protein